MTRKRVGMSVLAMVLFAVPSFAEDPPAFAMEWGELGGGNGQFNAPVDVAVNARGIVYVADQNNDRIQVFSSQGDFLATWGSTGSREGQFMRPTSLAIDVSNNVYVTELGNDRVQKFTADGTFLLEWGSEGTLEGQFNGPWGIAIGPDGNVFVADKFNHRIQRFENNGKFISEWGSEGSDRGEVNRPHHIAVDGRAFRSPEQPDPGVQLYDRCSRDFLGKSQGPVLRRALHPVKRG